MMPFSILWSVCMAQAPNVFLAFAPSVCLAQAPSPSWNSKLICCSSQAFGNFASTSNKYLYFQAACFSTIKDDSASSFLHLSTPTTTFSLWTLDNLVPKMTPVSGKTAAWRKLSMLELFIFHRRSLESATTSSGMISFRWLRLCWNHLQDLESSATPKKFSTIGKLKLFMRT